MKLPRSGDSGHKRTQLFLYPLQPEAHLDHHLVLDRYVPHNLKAAQKAQDLHISDKKVLKFNGLSDAKCRHAASQSLKTNFVDTSSIKENGRDQFKENRSPLLILETSGRLMLRFGFRYYLL